MVHLSLTWSLFPQFTDSLNTPSWALSAFFLCYLCFGYILRKIIKITNRRLVVFLLILCFVPGLLWGRLYVLLNDGNLFTYFHIFAPVRLLEFAVGMLLARLYYLNNSKPRKFQIQDIPWLNDLIIIAVFAAIYINLDMRKNVSPVDVFPLYHTWLPPLYALLLYRLARGNGLIARVFAFKAIRDLGKCGFYPYLLHIPLASWLCWCLENVFGYSRFLHSPVNIIVFMVFLYGTSLMYWRYARPKKGKTYRPAAFGTKGA
jgi:peptidoglycan/LPS O-acetylase OafA/YrhL